MRNDQIEAVSLVRQRLIKITQQKNEQSNNLCILTDNQQEEKQIFLKLEELTKQEAQCYADYAKVYE